MIGWWTATLVACAATQAAAQFTSGLISNSQAARGGMERAWYARAHLDPSRSSVVRWVLSGDQLLLLTSAGVVQALDANTGQSLWITRVGNPDYPSLGPATNDKLVGLVNGSTLYLLDRATGRVSSQRRLGGAPGAGPALGKRYVFVPQLMGRIEGYPLDEVTRTPWFYQSFGRILVSPLATPNSVVWGTDAGLLYVARSNPPAVQFRLETVFEFAAPPAYRAPLIYAVSLGGSLFAIDEQRGTTRWKYATGFPTDRAPAVVDDLLFVTSEEPTLHCINSETGIGQWEAPGISQFAAASERHVYGVDRFGTIHLLDKASGTTLGRYPTSGTLTALVNDQTDRLYLMTERGLVQCLHEIGASKPTYYVRPATAEPEPTPPEEEDALEEDAAPSEPTRPAAEPPAAPPDDEDFEAPFGGRAGFDDEPQDLDDESGFDFGDENPFE